MSYYDDPHEEYKKEKRISDWIGHPEKCPSSEIEKDIANNLKHWDVLYEDEMDNAEYEFDNVALLQRVPDGLYVILRTSGCSCPSPNENWGEEASGSLEEIFSIWDKRLKSWGEDITCRQGHELRLHTLLKKMIDEGNV